MGTNDHNTNMAEYVRSSSNKATDKKASEILTNKIHNKFSDNSSIGCFEDSFSLQVKDGSQAYQVFSRKKHMNHKNP